MILKALTLENFKGIREPVRIELAPLTLLFGPNNAGKSTIVQALMYAREVLERNNCDAGRTVLGGDVVDLGGFENLVHGHDRSRAIRMRFELHFPGGLPGAESDWVRDAELDSHIWDFYTNAPKPLDIAAAARLSSRLKDVWVELTIAWSARQDRPFVCTYAVGTSSREFARLSFDDEKEEAALFLCNLGFCPFGTRYDKGDLSEFDWAFAKEVRQYVRKAVWNHDHDWLNLKKGAQIAMSDEEVSESENRLSRRLFDKIVDGIVSGEGVWGDPSIDEETGEQNAQFTERERLIEIARSRTTTVAFAPPKFSLRDVILPDKASPDSESSDSYLSADVERPDHSSPLPSREPGPASESSTPGPSLTDKKTPCWNDWQSQMGALFDEEDHEIDSWMLEFLVALVDEDYVAADLSIPLRQRDSAVPRLGKTLDVDSRVWMRDDCNEFWEYPQFAQAFLQDVLSVAIVNPGRELLTMLEKAVYLSPFRRLPSRAYRAKTGAEPRSWANGLAAWDLLSLGSETSLREAVSAWLTSPDRFNAEYRVVAQRRKLLDVDGDSWNDLVSGQIRPGSEEIKAMLERLPEESKLELQHVESGLVLAPQDLGTGISQVIPVMVAALSDPSGQASRLVMIEEPEANIHPAFQVVLADLFLTQAKANPGGLFLIETHSEHLLLRCLRRIRETYKDEHRSDAPDVGPKDIAVHSVEPSQQGPVIHRIRIDEDGEFMDPWPRGFFPERMKEVYGDDL